MVTQREGRRTGETKFALSLILAIFCNCLFGIDVAVQLSYMGNDTFRVTVGDKTYTVDGHLQQEGDKTQLVSSIDGVQSKANIVINKNSVHVFNLVSRL